MFELVWAILDDGPAAGTVLELKVGDRFLEVIVDDTGVQCYKRHSFGPIGNHVAHFRFTHTKT